MDRKWLMMKTDNKDNFDKKEVRLAIKELEEALTPRGVICKTWAKPGVSN